MALADIVAAHATLLTGVSTVLGEENLDRNDAPPRVCWVPAGDTFQSASRVRPSSSVWPRSVGTRIAGVELHIWAAPAADDVTAYKELRATELLVDRVVYYLRRVAGGAFVLNGGRWLPVSDNHLGRVYVLNVLFSIAIVPAVADDPSVLTSFLHIDSIGDPPDEEPTMEGTMVLPGGDETGKPAP